MTTDFRVRRARPADAPELARLRWAFKQEDNKGGSSAPARSMTQAEQWFRERLDGGQWPVWVAESGTEICGHVFLHLVERVPDPYGDDSPLGYVTNFYVLPRYRNHGCGTALLQALRQHARELDTDVLIVWPSERSVPVYRRAGFRPSPDLLEAR